MGATKSPGEDALTAALPRSWRSATVHLGSRAALLVEVQREWMERQFQAMGLNQRARDLALELLCAAQGAALVAHALGDPGVMRRRFRDLEAWIRGLAREATPAH
jgi:hypothetical protein